MILTSPVFWIFECISNSMVWRVYFCYYKAVVAGEIYSQTFWKLNCLFVKNAVLSLVIEL